MGLTAKKEFTVFVMLFWGRKQDNTHNVPYKKEFKHDVEITCQSPTCFTIQPSIGAMDIHLLPKPFIEGWKSLTEIQNHPNTISSEALLVVFSIRKRVISFLNLCTILEISEIEICCPRGKSCPQNSKQTFDCLKFSKLTSTSCLLMPLYKLQVEEASWSRKMQQYIAHQWQSLFDFQKRLTMQNNIFTCT